MGRPIIIPDCAPSSDLVAFVILRLILHNLCYNSLYLFCPSYIICSANPDCITLQSSPFTEMSHSDLVLGVYAIFVLTLGISTS